MLNNNHVIICIDGPFHEEIDKWNLESNVFEFKFTKDFNEISCNLNQISFIFINKQKKHILGNIQSKDINVRAKPYLLINRNPNTYII